VTVEVLNTGSELLLGDVTNTHLPRIALGLAELGLRVSRQVSVPDGAPIRTAMAEAIGRCEILLVTGGLGPTADDVTREIAAELLGCPLERSSEVEAAIRARLASRGYELLPGMLRQAMVPRGASILANPHGTAPGLYLPPNVTAWRATPHVFLLPGPPRELLPMLDEHVIPRLREITGISMPLSRRVYRIVGMGESAVEQAVGLRLQARGDLEIGYCARPNEVDFRLIGPRAALNAVEPDILAAVGQNLVSRSGERLEDWIVNRLCACGESVSTAESCTGGLVAHRLTNVPGASRVFPGGVVTYSNDEKVRVLGVAAALIAGHGAVSAPVAAAMAEGIRKLTGSSHALSLTGIAGPDGGYPDKPVGTVFIGMASGDAPASVTRHQLSADRETFKQLASQHALDTLRRHLLKTSSGT
jgi:nicotinamide-nucleotide amidase